MTTFRPANDDHAVTSVRFYLRLDEFVEPPALQAAATKITPWHEQLPAIQTLPPVSQVIQGQTFEFPGLQCSVVRPDAQPIWALRFIGFEIVVECFAYTRWERVWSQARAFLGDAYKLVRTHQADANILEVRLQVVDRFLSESDDYDGNRLFKADGFIGNRLLSEKGPWHSNTGWFEYLDDARILHALNVGVRRQQSSDSADLAAFAFTVTHSQSVSPAPSEHLSWERVTELVEELHVQNKVKLTSLLQPEMLDRIGLKL